MLNALVISNAIVGLTDSFVSTDLVRYRFATIDEHFDPDLGDIDLLIVPNGSDHIAMLKIKDKVRAFLDHGNAVFCFCGWFTNWVPGNQWRHDNSKATKDVRLSIRTDRHGLFDGLDLQKFNFNHGISGFWACGYIEPNPEADVVLEDTWGRAVLVLDEVSTNGLMILTASGPVGDYSDNPAKDDGVAGLLRNMLRVANKNKEEAYETNRLSV